MRIPLATYRIQFNPSFDFRAGQKIIPYLDELGVSDIYASPIFKARTGSVHGYDIVDHNLLNPELGGTESFERLAVELKRHRLGWVQDIVPNHMAYHHENKMLMDILEKRECSEYFHFFDIDWDPPYENLKGKVLAPFLGRFYGEVLEDGEIQLDYEQGDFLVSYYGLKFSLNTESYQRILGYKITRFKEILGQDKSLFNRLVNIIEDFKKLISKKKSLKMPGADTDRVKTKLRELSANNKQIKKYIRENINIFNGLKGQPESFHLLDDLLSCQFFRMSFWKVATEEINYRRFFNLNEFITLRMEDQTVFDRIHPLIVKLTKQERFTGLRIDHVDGLYDPTDYLEKLRDQTGDVYLIVEKILDPEEELPEFWPVQGTTGYQWLNYVNSIFCETRNEKKFDRIYTSFSGQRTPYQDLLAEKKRLILGKHMAGDIHNLALLIKKNSEYDRHGRDITLYGLKRALVEMLAKFPVYRTYRTEKDFREEDQEFIQNTVKRCKQRMPGFLYEFDFLEKILLSHPEISLSQEEKETWIDSVMRFQQLTGPLMAKGFEDTFLYVFNRLLSLNEVGGNPGLFGISLDRFHRFNKRRTLHWPYSLNATSTHDTKRGEDVRARINVLSEIPQEWRNKIKEWSSINRRKKRRINGDRVPDKNDEYFLYQTLIGTFPFEYREISSFVERIKKTMTKSVREAKVHTAWLKPDTEYEEAFMFFIEELLMRDEDNLFLQEFLPFQRKVAHYGIFNSLSQSLLKITSPGIPDFYQGSELWDLNLVDPDNRRPVDFGRREALLKEITEKAERNITEMIPELLAQKEDGRVKLFLIHRALQARKERSLVFQNGAYIPLQTSGKWSRHVIAFAREYEGLWAISLAPRFLTSLIKEGEFPLGRPVWNDTHVILPEQVCSPWRDVISSKIVEGEKTLPMAEAFCSFPVALLFNQEEP
jgi:(1->4)-alpha-D-glucan 1-alpha-D-glucosylmutase